MPIILCSPFVSSFDMSPHCCFPWHAFLLKLVCDHIVIFHFFLPHLCSFLHDTLFMSVILVSCSFVIISFCSFFIVVMLYSMHTKLPVPILSYLNLCITSFYIFVSVYIYILKVLLASDCYIFVATFEVCACHWLLHFCHHIWGLWMPLIATFFSSWNIWWRTENQD